MRSILSLAVILVVCAAAADFATSHLPSKAVSVQSHGPTVERLERLTHLVTTRVFVADVLIGEGEGCRGAWLIRGDALIAVNLRQAKVTVNWVPPHSQGTNTATLVVAAAGSDSATGR